MLSVDLKIKTTKSTKNKQLAWQRGNIISLISSNINQSSRSSVGKRQ